MATIYDVAKSAGVSAKTVSRVLNGDSPVGPQTRARVHAAIEKLGYVPSQAARMMRSNRSGLIGLVTGALSSKIEPAEPSGLPELYIVQGFQQVLAGTGMTLMVADTGGRAENVPHLMHTFLQHRVEALVYVAEHHKEVAFDLSRTDCPTLLVNCYDRFATPAILPDDQSCQYELVGDLIRAGHDRIAYLGLDPGMTASALRKDGYRAALEDAGLAYDPALEHVAGALNRGDDDSLLEAALDRLLALPAPPSVLCCGNDEMALRAYGLLKARGLEIPKDISVAGFDNYRAIAERLYPPLTTVELPYRAMGRHAAEAVLAMARGAAGLSENPVRISGPVHWRSSVAARNSVTQIRSTGRI